MMKAGLVRRLLTAATALLGLMGTGAASAETIVAVTQSSYDALGREACTVVRMNPDAFGSAPDACTLGTQGTFGPDRITKTVYDAAGQVLQVREAAGTSIELANATYSYTPNGKQGYVIDANGNRTKWEYDGFDRLARWTFPSTTRPSAFDPTTQASALASAGGLNTSDYETYGYDAVGNRVSLRKRDGRSIGYAYDSLNRVAFKDLPSGEDVYYGYDLLGRQLYARFGSSTGLGLTSTYDAIGRIKSASNNLGGSAQTLSYTYDAAGNRTELKFPDDQIVTFEYDAANRMKAIKENRSAMVAELTYDALGRRSGLAQGFATVYGYDLAGRLNSLSHDLAGTGHDVTFAIPSFNTAGQAMSKSISNDAYNWRDGVAVARDYRANGLNQYDLVGVTPHGYDANGNLTSDGASSYVYDVENRLVSVSGSTTLALSYDPLGRLSQTSGSTGTTRFLYDGDALVAEYDGSGALLRRYVHGPGVDEPLIWYEGSGLAARRILRSDLQGSVVAIADAAGSEINTNTYDEFGLPGAGNQGRFAYTGQIRIPEIGMYYYKARIYSPSLGRFLQTDPIGYKDDFNLYAYTGNDPVNGSDPTGTEDLRSVYRDTYKNGYAGMPEDMAYLEGRYPIGFGAYTFAYGTLVTAPLFDWAAMGIGKLAGSVWGLGPAARGLEIEASVIKSMKADKLPVNFPTIDALRAGTAISVKSIDLAAPSYQSASRLAGTLDRYVAQLAKFRQATLSGRTVAEGVDFTSRELVVGVPKGGVSPAQAEVFSKAAERAKALDVNLTVREFR